MCTYSYTYYNLCRHGELIRLSYCDRAKALGLPQKHDRWRPSGPGPENSDGNDTHKPSDSASSASHGRSPEPDKTRSDSRPSPSGVHNRAHSGIMSTLRPSETLPTRSWVQVAAGPVQQPTQQLKPIANRIPRSALPEMDGVGAALQPSPDHYRNIASHDSPALDKSEYNKLNINIPLDTCSGFSMSLTHQDGKVQEIVTRFETLNERLDCSGFLSDDTRVHTGDTHTPASSTSTICHAESGADIESDTTHGTVSAYNPSLSPSTRRRPHVSSSPASERRHATPIDDELPPSPGSTRTKKKVVGIEGETNTNTPSVRKSLPSRWVGKAQGPSLATAQRAMQREVRKQASQSDLPTETNRKSLRASRSRSSIDHGSPRSPESAGQSIKITLSPTRISRSLLHEIDASTQSHLSAGNSKHSQAPSSGSSVGDYKTARQSPKSTSLATKPSVSRLASSSALATQRKPIPNKSEPPARAPRTRLTLHGDSDLTTRLKSTNSLSGETAASRQPVPENIQGLTSQDTVRSREASSIPSPKMQGQPSICPARTVDSEGVTPIPPGQSISKTPLGSGSPLRSDPMAESAPLRADITPSSESIGKETLMQIYPSSTASLDGIEPIEQDQEAVRSCPKALDMDYHVSSQAFVPTFSESRTELHADQEEASVSAVRPLKEASRNTSVASEATVKATPVMNRDPVQNDSAVIFSRKMAEGLGISSSHSVVDGTSSMVSKSSNKSSHSGVNEEASSPADTAADTGSYSRKKTPGESSLLSSLRSGLRADVPEFVPQGQPATQYPVVHPNDDEAVRYPTYPQPMPAFDPFGWDPYGNPLYNMLYTVQTVPPGATYDCGSYQPWLEKGAIMWPKYGRSRKSNGSPRRPRQNRGADGNGPPSKHHRAEAPQDSVHMQEPRTPGIGDTTPRAADSTPKPTNAPTEPVTDKGHLEPSNADMSEPFQSQLHMITGLSATMNRNPIGRAARHFSPAHDDEHQGETQGEQRPRGDSVDSGRSPTVESPVTGYATITAGAEFAQNGLQARPSRQQRGRGHRNRNWNPPFSAGVPLDATAPFPNPVPPRGPRRSDDERQILDAGASNLQNYMGYVVGNSPNACGNIHVVRTNEWSNIVCNACDPRH